MLSLRYVTTADQCFESMVPITRNLGSSTVFAGISSKSGSSQSTDAPFRFTRHEATRYRARSVVFHPLAAPAVECWKRCLSVPRAPFPEH